MTVQLSPQQMLDQKYTLSHGQALMSGSQALVRLPMLQKDRDRRAGLNTAGFISGYRGSPLSGFDQQLWRAEHFLKAHDVVFQPGLNEDLAATAVWGTQQLNLTEQAQFDGVFSLWYGKGPGVDRSIDAIKHANLAGSARYGGVLMVAGDDHAAKSSTTAHQSEQVMAAAGVPLLYPSNVQEFLDFGLHGWAMSRFSGLWVGLKCVTQVVETTSTVDIDPERQRILLPDDIELPQDGLNLRWPDMPLAQEARLVNHKWYAALAYIRVNRLNRIVFDAPQARFGIMAAGKAYQDVRQALNDLGLDRAALKQLGVRVLKVGCVWPLDAEGVSQFARGLDQILVVEEKRQLLEPALKEVLYHWPDAARPKVYGRFNAPDEAASARGAAGGEWALPRADWLLPPAYELSSSQVAQVVAKRLLTLELPALLREMLAQRLAVLTHKERAAAAPKATGERTPWFCSGCPHNTSTRVPEGSRALAGIGCHFMVVWMDRATATFSHMGGEGAAWIGQSPFTAEDHVFVNMGDGTYFHSGLLAIRAAIGAKVNVTYKILFNDAIAMTGGQPVDGVLSVPRLAQQVVAEGAARTVIVTDDLAQYNPERRAELPADVAVYHRDELDEVQQALRATAGTTVLIYEQMCATEKRRRRKRGTLPTINKHVFINAAVCEGCGDCSSASNCLSIEPLATPLGTKRRINYSTCNQDFSCVKGFCPSFVTVEGAVLQSAASPPAAEAIAPDADQSVPAARVPVTSGADALDAIPTPQLPVLDTPQRILITGVGGTGVITVGALIGMAAYIDGLASSALDMTGLAQKGGAVLSHVQLAQEASQLHAARIALAQADVLLGCDGIVSASAEALACTQAGQTKAVVNSNETPTAAFVQNRDWTFPGASVVQDVRAALGEDSEFIDANALALQLLGSTLYANALLIGYAWQKGWLPLQRASLLQAMVINGIKVAENQQAFQWGRYFAHHGAGSDAGGRMKPTVATSTVQFVKPANARLSASASNGSVAAAPTESVEALIERYCQHLSAYQNAAYAARYRQVIAPLQARERALFGSEVQGGDEHAQGDLALTRLAATYLAKLMAYKDEYEVARLYSQPEFMAKLRAQFAGEPGVDYRIKLNLAPPLLSKKNAQGQLLKREYGAWVLKLMPLLARLKPLRGTALDVFGYSAERQQERRVAQRYAKLIARVAAELTADNQAVLRDRLLLADPVRGFGHVKAAELAEFEAALDALDDHTRYST